MKSSVEALPLVPFIDLLETPQGVTDLRTISTNQKKFFKNFLFFPKVSNFQNI
jgi:hypothetical protein